MLSVLDGLWKDHLLSMDHLKEGIGLRGYAQQDPLVAYKKESFEMFEAMMLQFQEDTARHLFRMQIIGPDGQPIESTEQLEQAQIASFQHAPVPDPALPDLLENAALPTMALSPANAPADVADLPPLQQRSAPRVSKAPSTTIDALEREFERKKQRELDQARMAGSNGSGNGDGRHLSGDKVGRNDLCPCGSGKKFKKCHGAEV